MSVDSAKLDDEIDPEVFYDELEATLQKQRWITPDQSVPGPHDVRMYNFIREWQNPFDKDACPHIYLWYERYKMYLLREAKKERKALHRFQHYLRKLRKAYNAEPVFDWLSFYSDLMKSDEDC